MLETSQCIDKYTMQERLGRQETIEVWKTFDPDLQRPVVIKFLDSSQGVLLGSTQQLQQKIRILVNLNHPNIIQIYDISPHPPVADERAYVIMPYNSGPNLAMYIAQMVERKKNPSVLDIAQFFLAIASALDYTHGQGILHGGIKPTNILLDTQNGLQQPLLTDFGLTQMTSFTDEVPTVPGTHNHAHFYIAPELAAGKTATRQGDLYALGIILYELCTGKRPFQSPEQSRIAGPILPSSINQAISPALEAVILQGIARNPEERFSDIRTMTLAVLQALKVPLSPLLFVEYHLPFLKLLQVQAEKARNIALIEAAAAIVPEKLHYDESYDTEELPFTRKPARGDLPTKTQKDAKRRSTLFPSSLYILDYKFIPLTILPLILIGSMLLWPLAIGQPLPSPRHFISGVVSGQVRFLSSNQGDGASGQGINDEVSIDLTQVADPTSGKSYYAWLQADANLSDSFVILLGRLPVTQNSVHFLYRDVQHMNLLVSFSRFLITEESATVQPTVPSQDATSRLVSGMISQIPNPNDQNHYSLLDHLRHLLALDPELNKLGLSGGLSFRLGQSTQRLQDLAISAQKSFAADDEVHLRSQLLFILSDIDGIKNLTKDVPGATVQVGDTTFDQVGLLQMQAYQQPSAYLYHVGLHVLGLIASPGATNEQQKIATNVMSAITTVRDELEQIQTNTVQLLSLSPTQLLRQSADRQLVTIVHLTQVVNSGDNQTHAGVTWIRAQLALLALIPVKH